MRLGACPRLSGLVLAALCRCGGCVSWPLSRPGCEAWVWFPTTPFVCPPPSFSLPHRLGRCSPGALPGPTRAVVGVCWGWVGGGGP